MSIQRENDDNDDFWLAVKGRIVNITHNWDQNRKYDASLAERTEGFTEVWGNDSSLTSTRTLNYVVEEDAKSLEYILATPYPQQPITLFQYRPAWIEQLALQVSGLAFVVVNSPYAVFESTGPLPCLRELPRHQQQQQQHGSSDLRPPALVGRKTATFTDTNNMIVQRNNCILHYLQESHKIDWKRGLSEAQKPTAQLLLQLLEDTLEPCLTVLRHSDRTVWEQVYRQQSLEASSGSTTNSQWVAWWQVWSERIQAVRQLGRSQRAWTTDEALWRARQAYEILEKQLVLSSSTSSSSSKSNYLMGTEKPVLVDIVLFDSLARALTDVHLVVVLADFPVLCQYAQHIWDTYFEPPPVKPVDSDSQQTGTENVDDWMLWNAIENARNAFCKLPLLTQQQQQQSSSSSASSSSSSARDFGHAMELMNQLSLKSHDLHEQLLLAKKVRDEQDRHLDPILPRPFYTFYRWRMGDAMFPQKNRQQHAAASAAAAAQGADEQEVMRAYKRNDELWMTTIGVATVVSVLLFGFAGES